MVQHAPLVSVTKPARTVVFALGVAITFVMIVGCGSSADQRAAGGGPAPPDAGPLALLNPPPADTRTGGIALTLAMRGEGSRAADLELTTDGEMTFYGGSAAMLRGLSEQADRITVLRLDDAELARVLALMQEAGWIAETDIPAALRALIPAVEPEAVQSEPGTAANTTSETARFRVRVRAPSIGGDRLRFEADKGSPAWELLDSVAGLAVQEQFPDLRP